MPAGDRCNLAFTTNPGLEDLVFAELCQRLTAAGLPTETGQRVPVPLRGRMQVKLQMRPQPALAIPRRMRSVHHVLQPLVTLKLSEDQPLATLERTPETLTIPELVPGMPFRVTARRHGHHSFGSPEIARRSGAALVRRHAARVDLEHPALEVLITVVDHTCAVALRRTRRPLSHRLCRPARPATALRSNVAYAALHLAGAGLGTRRVLDPFCGSGTILLEAGAAAPAARLWGGDWRRRAVTGTRTNLAAAGLAARADVRHGDAGQLSREWPLATVDVAVTDPPLGRRLAGGTDFFRFYFRLLEQVDRVLAPDGRMVLLTRHRSALQHAAERQGSFRISRTVVVDLGGLFAGLVLLLRRHPRAGLSRARC